MLLIIQFGNNRDEFSKKLIELTNESNNKILRFLAVFPDYAREIQKDNIENIVSSILDVGDKFPNDDAILYGTPMRIHIIINSLLENVSVEVERFHILKNGIEESTRSLYTLVWEIDSLNELHGRYDSKILEIPEENLIVSTDHLVILEDLVCTKIKTWAENGKLESHKKIVPILEKWKQWGARQTEIDRVISNVIENDRNLINFLSNFISPVYGNGITWKINFGLMNKFVNVDSIEIRLNSIDPLNNLGELNDMEKIAVKLFFNNVKTYKLDSSQKILPQI